MSAKDKPILVFGKSGQIGAALHDLLGRKAVFASREDTDFTNPSTFSAYVESVNPSAMINAAAYTQVDKAEEESEIAHIVNADAPAELARIAKKRGIPFVHYSTDYVFSGKGKKAFKETDATNPINVYGKTKLAGERAVLDVGAEALIFRTSWVYDARGKNFFNTMLSLAMQRKELRVVSDQIGAPSYAPHLANATIEALVMASHLDVFPSGIYHMCNAGEVSWHGFAKEIFAAAGRRDMLLELERCHPITSSEYPTPAKRPLNSRLNCEKLDAVFDIVMQDWQEGVAEAIEQKIAALAA